MIAGGPMRAQNLCDGVKILYYYNINNNIVSYTRLQPRHLQVVTVNSKKNIWAFGLIGDAYIAYYNEFNILFSTPSRLG